MKASVKVEHDATVYIVRNGIDWGTIVVRKGKQSVQVLVDSSYGSYSYYWGTCGKDPIKFLCGMDRDYAMNKLAGLRYMELDRDKIAQVAKGDIICARKSGSLEHGEARELWDDLEQASRCIDGQELQRFLWEHQLFHKVWDLPPDPMRPTAQCVGFWEYIWKPFVEYLERMKTCSVNAFGE